VSRANAIAIRCKPTVAGAFVLTDATPEAFVFALRATPLRVNLTVFLDRAFPTLVFRVADSVIEAPCTAEVGAAYLSTGTVLATLRVGEIEAAAVVASPSKTIPIRYEPTVAGAFILTEAMPEVFVFALSVTRLRVNPTVSPAVSGFSFADSVIVMPGAAEVGPV
jgi:hypothetical protein